MTLVFYLLSVDLVADGLMRSLESYAPLKEHQFSQSLEISSPSHAENSSLIKATAIVLLGGGRDKQAPEYGDDTVSKITLIRSRYAAWLQRKTLLPLYVSGGRTQDSNIKSEAQLMQEVLQNEFNVVVAALEEQSKTTYENALFSSQLLKANSIDSVYLVTSAWHMQRSVQAFEHFGIKVIAAPTGFESDNDFRFQDLIPSSRAFQRCVYALHEMFGQMWYRLRYY